MSHARALALFLVVAAATAFLHARLRGSAWPRPVARDFLTVSVRTVGPGAVSCLERVPRGGAATCWVEASPGAALAGLVDNGVDRTGAVTGGEYELSGLTEAHWLVVSFVRVAAADGAGPRAGSLATR